MSVTNRGYTLLEMLLCLIIISMMSLFALNYHQLQQLDHLYFLNEYLIMQSETIVDKKPSTFKNGITFNEMGHVNQARTIHFGKYDVIIHLGNGYASIK